MTTEKTQEQTLIDSLKQFASVSTALVGVENTNNTLVFMADLIAKNPDMYQKIFDPKRIEQLMKIISELSEKGKIDMFTAVAYLPKVLKIYK